MPRPTLEEISPGEHAHMRAELRRARYGYLLALHLLLRCAAGRTPSEVAAVRFCSRSSVYFPVFVIPPATPRAGEDALCVPLGNRGVERL